MDREDEVRLIAYRLWEEDNFCHGRDFEHWVKAELIWEENQKNKRVQKRSKENKTSRKKTSK